MESGVSSYNIGIVLSEDFKNEISQKIDSGEYIMNVKVTTYSYASRTEIWVGAIVAENQQTFNKIALEFDIIYNPVITNEDVYAPLAGGNYTLNGR